MIAKSLDEKICLLLRQIHIWGRLWVFDKILFSIFNSRIIAFLFFLDVSWRFRWRRATLLLMLWSWLFRTWFHPFAKFQYACVFALQSLKLLPKDQVPATERLLEISSGFPATPCSPTTISQASDGSSPEVPLQKLSRSLFQCVLIWRFDCRRCFAQLQEDIKKNRNQWEKIYFT